jgi:hypothetical protein
MAKLDRIGNGARGCMRNSFIHQPHECLRYMLMIWTQEVVFSLVLYLEGWGSRPAGKSIWRVEKAEGE